MKLITVEEKKMKMQKTKKMRKKRHFCSKGTYVNIIYFFVPPCIKMVQLIPYFRRRTDLTKAYIFYPFFFKLILVYTTEDKQDEKSKGKNLISRLDNVAGIWKRSERKKKELKMKTVEEKWFKVLLGKYDR